MVDSVPEDELFYQPHEEGLKDAKITEGEGPVTQSESVNAVFSLLLLHQLRPAPSSIHALYSFLTVCLITVQRMTAVSCKLPSA